MPLSVRVKLSVALMLFNIKEHKLLPFCFSFNLGYDSFSQAFDLVQGALVSFMHPFYSSWALYVDIFFIFHV